MKLLRPKIPHSSAVYNLLIRVRSFDRLVLVNRTTTLEDIKAHFHAAQTIGNDDIYIRWSRISFGQIYPDYDCSVLGFYFDGDISTANKLFLKPIQR